MLLGRLSLGTRLIAAFLFITLLPLGCAGYLSFLSLQRTLSDRGNDALFSAALQTANHLDGFIRGTLDSVRAEATFPTLVEYLSLPDARRAESVQENRATAVLRALHGKDEFFVTSYALLDPDGTNLLDTLPSNMGQDESDRDYVRRAREAPGGYVSPVQLSRESEEANLYFSHPVCDDDGGLLGILRVQFSAAVLQHMVSATQELAGERSFAVLLDEHHIRLGHAIAPEMNLESVVPLDAELATRLQAEGRLPAKPPDELSADLPAFEQGLHTAGTDQPYFTTRLAGGGGGVHQAAVVRMETRPWSVVFMQPRDVFFEPIEAQTRDTLLLAVLIIVLATLVAVAFAQILSAPITRLTRVASEIAGGDLDQQIESTGTDELAQLARSFARMQDSVRAKIDELNSEITKRKQAEETLRQHAGQLENTVERRTRELRAAQQQLVRREKLAVLGQLAGGMAHELRNPLGVISNAVYFLRMTLPDVGEETAEYLTMVDDEIRRAGTIITDLLDFSRVRPAARHGIGVAGLVEDALGKLEIPADVEVCMRMDPSLPDVFVDGQQVCQVLVNVFTNACQAMHKGGKLTVRARAEEGMVAVSIHDTGCGIPEENLKLVFEPLFTTKARGIGLGLAVSTNLMELNGGSLRVESREGEGSTFTLRLATRKAPSANGEEPAS